MEEPLNICVTCLSTDRCLVPLHKITMLLQEIHFVELKQFHGGVCWECWSTLAKFYRFKNRAKVAQETLSQTTEHFNIKPLTTLISKTNIFYDYQYIYSLDPLTNCNTILKAEPETIKQEIIDQSDDNIDNTSDIDEKKSKIQNVHDDLIEIKYDDNFLRKQEIIEPSDDSIDNTSELHEKSSDLDENLSDIPENLKNYVDMVETKHIRKQKCSQCVTGNKINFAEVIFSETDEKPREEITGNVYVKTKEEKPSKNILKRKAKRDIRRDAKDFQEKFVRVVLSEEEMLRVREEKRSHYNYKKIPYKCDSCVLGFTRKETYSLHLKKKHDASIGDQVCNICCIRFRHKLALNNHKTKHYTVYRCRLCKYEAHEFIPAVNHCKSKHVADKPDRIHCPQCTVVVKTPDDLEAHIQTVHSLFCDCGIKFKDKSSLRRHISRAHSELRNFICDICQKTFKTKTRLETHMVTHSGNIAMKLAYCQQCKVQYKNIKVYRSHLKSSANHSEGYPCTECNKKFRSKGYLKQHYDFYHLRKSQYKCEICNTIFISNWRLRNHKQQYHGLSRPRNHSCNTCGKKFFTSATLRSHQFTHSDQRSFMCEDCGDTFKQRAALYTHTRLVHKGGGSRKKRDC